MKRKEDVVGVHSRWIMRVQGSIMSTYWPIVEQDSVVNGVGKEPQHVEELEVEAEAHHAAPLVIEPNCRESRERLSG